MRYETKGFCRLCGRPRCTTRPSGASSHLLSFCRSHRFHDDACCRIGPVRQSPGVLLPRLFRRGYDVRTAQKVCSLHLTTPPPHDHLYVCAFRSCFLRLLWNKGGGTTAVPGGIYRHQNQHGELGTRRTRGEMMLPQAAAQTTFSSAAATRKPMSLLGGRVLLM